MQNRIDPTDVERLLGMIAALGSEVFVLKAEQRRLRQALASAGVVGEAQLEAAASSPELERWLREEEKAFGAHLMRPFVHPDEAPDVSAMMTER